MTAQALLNFTDAALPNMAGGNREPICTVVSPKSQIGE